MQNCTVVIVAHGNGERPESVLSSPLQVSSEARHGLRTVKEEERESEGRASQREREREWNCIGAGTGRKNGSRILNPK